MLAILLAVLAAIALSVGAQLQNDTVTSSHGESSRTSLKLSSLLALAAKPRWLLGTVVLGVAILLQLSALSLAPLIVVQPIGALALIVTAVLNSRIYSLKLDLKTWGAIALTILGLFVFVSLAAGSAVEQRMDDERLLLVVGGLIAVTIAFAALFAFSRGKVGPLHFIFGAGVIYGFVASLAKVVLLRISQSNLDWLTLLAVAGLIGGTFLGGWFVQNAYASGPPDLVIAGLTVIDPAVAVGIAIVILGEASEAGPAEIIGYGSSGILAAAGVLLLARVHPQLNKARE